MKNGVGHDRSRLLPEVVATDGGTTRKRFSVSRKERASESLSDLYAGQIAFELTAAETTVYVRDRLECVIVISVSIAVNETNRS